MTDTPAHTRRDTLVTLLAATSVLLPADAGAQTPAPAPTADDHRHDWDWLVGRWNVRHRRLKQRLLNNHEWEEFAGTSTLWLTLNGHGTVDDNWLDLPTGAYRAVGIRSFDPATQRWAIWWLDERNPHLIDVPVYGTFANGIGRFEGDDVLRGQPIKVYYQWSDITPNTARWEQGFSADGGATWEVNWVMYFTRAA
jgi:hypothetical protein